MHTPKKLDILAGLLFFIAIVSTLVSHLIDDTNSSFAGLLIWAYFILRFRSLGSKPRKQISIIMGLGVCCLIPAYIMTKDTQILRPLLNANQLIITLVGAVTFLRLIASFDKTIPNLRGPKAIISTLLGTHLISSVINISAVILVSDRIKKDSRLTTAQGLVMLRGFGSAAHWSPFFAAMGVTLISTPDASLTKIFLITAPVAAISLIFTWWQLSSKPETAENFEGYPLNWISLKIPLTLASLVLITHAIAPELSIINLVSSVSLLFTLLILTAKHGAPRASSTIREHCFYGLPGSANEVSLFLASSVLAAGLAAIIQVSDLNLTPEHFGVTEAWCTLLILVALSFIGVHPVTSNLVAGSLLLPSVSDHNLLAITLLLAWGLGVILSPFSGNQILLQARYGIRARDLFKANLPYMLLMLPVGLSAIWIYARIN